MHVHFVLVPLASRSLVGPLRVVYAYGFAICRRSVACSVSRVARPKQQLSEENNICHGEDFLASGDLQSLEKLCVFSANLFEIKLIGKVGPGLSARVFFLKRQISWTEDGFEWLGDERHVKRLAQIWNIEGCKPTVSPGAKATGHNRDCLDLLSQEETSLFRSAAGAVAHIAFDRWDAMFACKPVLNGMASTTVGHLSRLRRLGRYPMGVPSLVWRYPYQMEPTVLTVHADSEWAGDSESRRSTTAVIETLGAHPTDCSSVTQGAIALSSGEAELEAANRVAAGGLQTRAILKGLGAEVGLKI
jgi:hypothetical protein